MALINIRHPDERIEFMTAVRRGIGTDGGLFFPERIEPLEDVDAVLDLGFQQRSGLILDRLTGGKPGRWVLEDWVNEAFDFPCPLVPLADGSFALELFHGPSLAFKDFGARFLARCLSGGDDDSPMTILTATSGDTGAAVALAFHGLPGIEVVVLYPEGGVTPLQEKLFCTLGGNVRTYSVAADFDACQGLVKKAFEDARLRQGLGLNSANSINIARLLAQVCYYFEAIAGLPERGPALCSVPSGNFGNVTAGLIARRLGLPVRLMAATNANDTVPRYFEQGRWAPRATVKTITNAMDISQPNNFDRVLDLEQRHGLALAEVLSAVSVSEDETRAAIAKLDQLGYLADPHSALAWQGMQSQCRDEEAGIFLCTAHPAKFRETIESVIGREIELPEPLSRVLERPVLSESIPADYEVLRDRLLNRA